MLNRLWDRFDYKVLLLYTGYKNRYTTISQELERVGLTNVEHRWDCPTPLKTIISKGIETDNMNKNIGRMSCTLAHYLAIKTAYCLDKEYVLIMEDDIRFRKDVKVIEDVIRSLPSDFDYAQLEYLKPFRTSIADFNDMLNGKFGRLNEHWVRFDNLTGGGCYALSRKGMAFMIESMEYAMSSKSAPLKMNDFYVSQATEIRKYCAIPSIAAQCCLGLSNSLIDGFWNVNEQIGIHFEDYNMVGTKPPISEISFLEYLEKAILRPLQKRTFSFHKVLSFWDFKKLLPYALSDATITEEEDFDVALMWGYSNAKQNHKALSNALCYKKPIIFVEPGFISSATTWAQKTTPYKFRIEHSCMIDTKGQFFDATIRTDIEDMLNNPSITIDEDKRREARRLIEKIVSNKISKYNHQPIFTPNIGRKGVRKVLVVDQSYGDFSIKRGMADESTFEKMLNTAIAENPDADILVKTHPDTLAGKKADKMGYYQDIKESNNVYKVTFPVNPYSLMEICDKVYVCSSQFGLEALMAGKEVHVFGMPFYAGWGLTIDDQHLVRRTHKRTLEELFYIIYCMYTHWADPERGCKATIDDVIDKMITLRSEMSILKASGRFFQETNKVSRPNGYTLGGFNRPRVFYGDSLGTPVGQMRKGYDW